MRKYITIEGDKYPIRGIVTAQQLRERFTQFQKDRPGTGHTFKGWCVAYGHIGGRKYHRCIGTLFIKKKGCDCDEDETEN